MVRLPRALAAALVVLLACGNSSPTPPSDPVDGLITSVSAGEIVLVLEGGGSFTFQIADESVPVPHLEEHRDQRLPVRVTWEQRDAELLATKIDDA